MHIQICFYHSKCLHLQAKGKPFQTTVQRKKRLLWAKERQSWTQRQWVTIIFSDDSKFELCVGDMRTTVIRTKKEAYHRDFLKRTVKFPASIMIWGCMSAKSLGQLHLIDNTVNAVRYINILEKHLMASADKLSSFGEFTFQQDGTPAHTAKVTKKWFRNNINVLDWPSSSPDLNPIESVWAIMKRRLRNDPQTTIAGLKRKIQEIWDSITPDECQDLVNSMNKRIVALIKANGNVTQY